jgi:hypothetical protein
MRWLQDKKLAEIVNVTKDSLRWPQVVLTEKETTNAGNRNRRKTYEDARSQGQSQIARADARKKEKGRVDPRNSDGRGILAVLRKIGRPLRQSHLLLHRGLC